MAQKNIKILLIEDSTLCVYTLKKIIEGISSFPVKLTYRATMESALSFLEEREQDIDLILLDLGLPDTCSAEESFSRIKGAVPNLPIVVLTGEHDHALANSMVRGGAQDYVNKDAVSANPKVLVNAIDFSIRRHRNQQKITARLEKKDEVISWMSGDYSVGAARRESNG